MLFAVWNIIKNMYLIMEINNMTKYKKLKEITSDTEIIWKKSRGIAPDSVANKMDEAMLYWMTELTSTLSIWMDKNVTLTDGELILARTNLGALVECWLKFFYCVYYEDYLKIPKRNKKDKIIEPNKMTFNDLKTFSLGILWEDIADSNYLWVEKIQYQRNAIHAFNYRDIGTPIEFMDDVDKLCEFVDFLRMRLPSIEDCM